MKNDLKFALRMIRRHKAVSLVNILGLAVSLGACFLMMIYVVNETRYEDFHQNGDRIYRIDLGLLTFIAAGGLAFLITVLTVGFQAARAARTNPVDCLRYE